MTTKITYLPITKDLQEDGQSWDNRSNFFINMHTRQDRVDQIKDFVQFVQEHNLAKAGDHTLDIGCGTGDYAIGLAHMGACPTGIDLSKGMIEGAKQLANKEGLFLSLYQGAWSEATRQSLHWDKTFNLAYSIFCPIMYDIDNLLAMTRASRGRRLLIAFKTRTDKIVDSLSQAFYGHKAFPWNDACANSIQGLKDAGYTPEVITKVIPTEEVLSLNEATKYFSMRIHVNTMSHDAIQDRVRKLLLPQVKNGVITNENVDTVNYIMW